MAVDKAGAAAVLVLVLVLAVTVCVGGACTVCWDDVSIKASGNGEVC
jgi:hypothetical protein